MTASNSPVATAARDVKAVIGSPWPRVSAIICATASTRSAPSDAKRCAATGVRTPERAGSGSSTCPPPIVTVGAAGDTVRLSKLDRDGFAQRLTIEHDGRAYEVRLPLIGTYQVANALVAAGLAIAVGEDPAVVIPALAGLSGVKGRLEIVGEKNGGLAVVDYAHKPEALEAALDGVRPFVTGKLISVFGCGGDRDRGKRPIMGAISVKRADVTMVTDDNPRTEEPAAIRAEILAAAPGAVEIGDRAAAIREAVRLMQPGDVVVVAGKGHETGQIVGQRVLPFSDHDFLREALLNP